MTTYCCPIFPLFPSFVKIGAANLDELKLGLSELQRQYRREADKRVRAEEAKSAEEERLFAALVRTLLSALEATRRQWRRTTKIHNRGGC